MMTLLVALALCALGTLFSVIVPSAFGRLCGFLLMGAAGVAAVLASLQGLSAGTQSIGFAAAQTHLLLRLDPTSAFFVGVLGVVAMLVSLYGLGPRTTDERRTGRAASATACAILFASILACVADDVLLFIFAWELLALTFYWAIAYSGTDPKSPKAAYVTIVVTHIAGACIVASLLFLAHVAGSFEVEAVVAAGARTTGVAAGVLLMLLLVGFGAKFGMLPMQVWMPYGYRSAPSVVAALMAGGALNVGFYGVTRFIVGFPDAPLWLGIVAIGVGAITAFFGIAWASSRRDMRRLAAYSSVENGGIILAAFGVAIAGGALHDRMLVGFAIAAALVQIAAHAAAKTTLFLSIASIGDACSTLSFDALGGLSRRLPVVSVVVLICGMSLAALPPLAGFVGEWLVLESLMQAFRTGNVTSEVAFALGGAVIGVAAGIAVVTFTKFVGIGVLGADRAERVPSHGAKSPWRHAGLVIGAACVICIGVFAISLLRLVAPSIDGIAEVPATQAMIGSFPLVQPTFAGFSSISPSGLCIVLCGFTLMFWIIARLISRPRGRYASTWTSGEPYRPWTQYTGTGYANPTRVILDAAVRTVRDTQASARGYASEIRPFFDLRFYEVLAKPFIAVGALVRTTQSGVIAAYLSYILVFTILMLVLFPSIRHW
ncbi:MAG TPA: proton-conducting transporter membrane subunit [Candidatus Baltobacteraceae bacterium]|nr:proton-conducting transporter membrane subunit [Candidatus Baltobacteraceae bacterium]